jgi:hypothetical protein
MDKSRNSNRDLGKQCVISLVRKTNSENPKETSENTVTKPNCDLKRYNKGCKSKP